MNKRVIIALTTIVIFLVAVLSFLSLPKKEPTSMASPYNKKIIVKINNLRVVDTELKKPILTGQFGSILKTDRFLYVTQGSLGLKRINKDNGSQKLIYRLKRREEIGGVAVDSKGLIYIAIAKTVPLKGTGEAVVESTKALIFNAQGEDIVKTVSLPKQAYRGLKISRDGQLVASNLHGYANQDKRGKIYFVDLSGVVKRTVDLGPRQRAAAFFDIDSNDNIYHSTLANAKPFYVKKYDTSGRLKNVRINKLVEYMRFVGIDGKLNIYISGDGYPQSFLYKYSPNGKLLKKQVFKAGLGFESYKINIDQVFLLQTGKDNVIRLHRIQ